MTMFSDDNDPSRINLLARTIAGDALPTIAPEILIGDPPEEPEVVAADEPAEWVRDNLVKFSKFDPKKEVIVFNYGGREFRPTAEWLRRYRVALLRRMLP